MKSKVVISIDFGSFGFASAFRLAKSEEIYEIPLRVQRDAQVKNLAALLLRKPHDPNYVRPQRPKPPEGTLSLNFILVCCVCARVLNNTPQVNNSSSPPTYHASQQNEQANNHTTVPSHRRSGK